MTRPVERHPAATARPPRVARSRRTWRRSRRQPRHLLFALPAIAFLLLFFLYPLYLILSLSLHEVSLGTVARSGNSWVGLDNYKAVLESEDFRRAVPRTAVFLAVTVVLQLVLGLGLAVILNERLRGVRIARSLVFFVWLMPPVVSGTIWRFMLNGTDNGVVNWALLKLHLIDQPVVFLTKDFVAMAAITLVNTWAGVPFVAIIFMAALQGVPQELYEAARVDGASSLRRFTAVTLPSVRPTTAILALLLTIYSFKTFDYILVLTGGGPGTDTATVPFLAYLTSFTQYDFGQGAAIGVLAVIASLVLSLPYLRRARREGTT